MIAGEKGNPMQNRTIFIIAAAAILDVAKGDL